MGAKHKARGRVQVDAKTAALMLLSSLGAPEGCGLRELFARPDTRKAVKGAAVVIGKDIHNGGHAVFYGVDLVAVSPGGTFRLPEGANGIVIDYNNDTDDLEYLCAAVEHLKGSCCYDAWCALTRTASE